MIKTTFSFVALAGVAVALASCGGVPGNAVATVDGQPIEKSDFSYYLTVLAKSAHQKPAQLRTQAVQILLGNRWVEGEAKAQGVSVSDADVKKSFAEQKTQSFPKDADYKKFLRTSGQTEQGLLERVKVQLLSDKIRDKVVKGHDTVSDAAIADFYNKNKARFAQPEKRDLRVVLTKTEADADKARAALDSGDSWAKVAKQYSIDDTSRAAGGKLPAQAKGTLDKALDDAVFSASKHELKGPIKTQYGSYVFTVTGITAASRQTLAKARPTIEQTLQTQNQQKVLDAFLKDFTKRWKDKTECSDAYKTSDCRNGPKATPTPTA